jgi:hypothetical protein
MYSAVRISHAFSVSLAEDAWGGRGDGQEKGTDPFPLPGHLPFLPSSNLVKE